MAKKKVFGALCGAGHLLTPENTYTKANGFLVCATCQQIRQRKYREELREIRAKVEAQNGR
jgi:hypothetical protein